MSESKHNEYMTLADDAAKPGKARDKLKNAADFFFDYPESGAFLALITVDNPESELTGYFNGDDISLYSFIMPKSFDVKDVKFDGSKFTFINGSGKEHKLSYSEMRDIWDLLPAHEAQRNAAMVENAFYKGETEPDQEEVSTKLGLFKWEHYARGYNSNIDTPLGTIDITVQVRSSQELDKMTAVVEKIISGLEEYDKTARDDGEGGEEEGIPYIIIYTSGAFDLLYDPGEDGYCDYVGVQFSADGELLDTYYG